MGDLAKVADVDIDASGVFKYILIKVAAGAHSKWVVRGHARCGFHADIFDEFNASLGAAGKDLKTKCVGGGRINHQPEKRNINVYGYSQGFGQADHAKSVEILKTAYPDYSISYSNEGY